MEDHVKLSDDQKYLGTTEKVFSSRSSHGIKLKDRLKSEDLSYVDFHHEITKGHPFNYYQHKQVGEKATKEEELVKYMSDLPSYLEKDDKAPQEKALNVGVLNWERLEKWQSINQKNNPSRNRRHSLSSSSSSFCSTDPSSTYSSRGGLSFKGNVRKFHDLPIVQRNILIGHSGAKLVSNVSVSDIRWPNFESCKTGPYANGKMKAQAVESTKKADKLQPPSSNIDKQARIERPKTVVLILPQDLPQKCNDLRTPDIREARRKSSSDICDSRKTDSQTILSSDLPHSWSLPCEVEVSSSIDSQTIELSPAASHPLQRSDKILSSLSRHKSSEEKSRAIKPELKMDNALAAKEKNPLWSRHSTAKLELKMETVLAAKQRNPSPTRRFITSMSSRILKSSISRDDSACLDNLSDDKLNLTKRAKSSPLRRLLDPLLKPKETFTDRDSPNVHSVKMKLDLTSCKKVNVKDSYKEEKSCGSLSVQALAKVAVKNGLPVFTFAIDNNSEILAATMKKLDESKQDKSIFIYTFFTIKDIKKKGGSRINQGSKKGKDKAHGYVPNVIGEMKVSEFHCTNHYNVKEFVSFSLEVKQEDDGQAEFHPNNEVAAVVVKIPNEEKTSLSLSKNVFLSTTVILPNGVHALPCKGEPSPLIERWKSGGFCDCGGWDLGCKLRVFANQRQLSMKERFQLFSQVGVHQNGPIFSMCLFKNAIYSVEFDSSLSPLQAFSICIAVLNSSKPAETSDLSKLREKQVFQGEK